VEADRWYAGPVRRIQRLTLLLSLGGTIAGFGLGGWPAGFGFLTGALISYLNFFWLKRLVETLGAPARRGSRATVMAVLLGLRYGLLGAGGYVMLRVFGVSLLALLAGLLTVVAAVILEALYQLFTYART
jgi:ATP synthase I chain.